ncbi:hypothetical protein GJ496_009583 [Pomphorhynchus laevis]|nr:hypothetical protein GJ496_009583 [Pomphorhynchus laevis]
MTLYGNQLEKDRAHLDNKQQDAKPLCKNEYNNTGLCQRDSCPLANSQYATVREHEGRLYLYMKVVERCPYPNRQWQKIKLSARTQNAVDQIDKHLIFWPAYMRQRCKLRTIKLNQVLRKSRKLQLSGNKLKITTVRKKGEKRDKIREHKALKAAKIERVVEEELVERLKKGVYGDIYSVKAIEDTMANEEVLDESEYQENMSESEIEYVEDMEESESEIEEIRVPAKVEKLKLKHRHKSSGGIAMCGGVIDLKIDNMNGCGSNAAITMELALLDSLNNELDSHVEEIKATYNLHYPELNNIITNDIDYCKFITIVGDRRNAGQNAPILVSTFGVDVEHLVRQSCQLRTGRPLDLDDDLPQQSPDLNSPRKPNQHDTDTMQEQETSDV